MGAAPDVVVVVEEDDEPAPELLATPEVVVALKVVVVVPAAQPLTQKTLCLVSAPREPSAWIVSLTWNPWLGCGWMPSRSSV